MSDTARVWIAKRKTKGQTTYRLRWIDPVAGKWRSRAAGTDRRVADREAAKLEEELARGTYRHIASITWSDFVKDHVSKIEGDTNATHAQRVLTAFGKLCNPAGPKDVNYTMIEAFAAHRRAQGNSPATVNYYLTYLRAALNRAVKRGYAARNPLDPELFQSVEDKPPRIATEAEETALLDAADALYGFRVQTFIHAALNTGGCMPVSKA